MGYVAADRTGVHGAWAIDMPPGSTGREKRDSCEGRNKSRQAERSYETRGSHNRGEHYIQNQPLARDSFLK